MAIYRSVHVAFWKDPKVLEEFTPEDKLFFLYLMTNPNTTQIGIYKVQILYIEKKDGTILKKEEELSEFDIRFNVSQELKDKAKESISRNAGYSQYRLMQSLKDTEEDKALLNAFISVSLDYDRELIMKNSSQMYSNTEVYVKEHYRNNINASKEVRDYVEKLNLWNYW